MESPGEHLSFLKTQYNLHNEQKNPEVASAARRQFKLTEEKVPQNPLIRIQNYLNRFHEITDRPDLEDRNHGILALKRFLFSKFVIKPENIPQNYFDEMDKLFREKGLGRASDRAKAGAIKEIIDQQKTSLGDWIDYLSSEDAPFSDALKYFTFRSVINMAQRDDITGKFPQRSKETINPFPDLNPEALALALERLGKRLGKDYEDIQLQKKNIKRELKLIDTSQESADKMHELQFSLSTLEQQELSLLGIRPQGTNDSVNPQATDFSELYAWALDQVIPKKVRKQELLAKTEGRWISYPQGSDPTSLIKSLEGQGTGWCTVSKGTATRQLSQGDFYVYYSLDENGNPTIPRVAIRMVNNQIGEVAGIEKRQRLDEFIRPVLDEKLPQLPGGNYYYKKEADMNQLTQLDHKVLNGEPLTHEELIFLYEINRPIMSISKRKDPRIHEIRATRDTQADLCELLECNPSQIARTGDEINETTKVFLGKLIPGIFDKLRNVEHIYTDFPEGRVTIQDVPINGTSTAEQIQQFTDASIYVGKTLQGLPVVHSELRGQSKSVPTIRLRAQSLGFESGEIALQDVYVQANALGLGLCNPEVAFAYRLQYVDQPDGERVRVATPQFFGKPQFPKSIIIAHNERGLSIEANAAKTVSSKGILLFKLYQEEDDDIFKQTPDNTNETPVNTNETPVNTMQNQNTSQNSTPAKKSHEVEPTIQDLHPEVYSAYCNIVNSPELSVVDRRRALYNLALVAFANGISFKDLKKLGIEEFGIDNTTAGNLIGFIAYIKTLSENEYLSSSSIATVVNNPEDYENVYGFYTHSKIQDVSPNPYYMLGFNKPKSIWKNLSDQTSTYRINLSDPEKKKKIHQYFVDISFRLQQRGIDFRAKATNRGLKTENDCNMIFEISDTDALEAEKYIKGYLKPKKLLMWHGTFQKLNTE